MDSAESGIPVESVRVLVVRGAAAGAVAGFAAFLVAWLVGEGPLQAGITYENAHEVPGAGGTELVSRAGQVTVGLGAAAVLFAIALGAVFGVLYRPMSRRLGDLGPRGSAAILAGIGFLTVFLVPAIKYPPNPPGTSDPDTIDERTLLWLAMLAISVMVTGAVVAASAGLRTRTGRFGGPDAELSALAAGAVVVILAWALLPDVDETPLDFAASQLWRYRVAAIAVQAALWATLGIVFGVLAARAAPPAHGSPHGRGNAARIPGLSWSPSGGRDARSG